MLRFLEIFKGISFTPDNDYTAMTRFLELGSGISSTSDIMTIPPWIRRIQF